MMAILRNPRAVRWRTSAWLPASLSITTQPASVFARQRSNSTTGQPLSARRSTSRPEASAGAMMMPSTFFDRKSRIRAFSRSVSEFRCV